MKSFRGLRRRRAYKASLRLGALFCLAGCASAPPPQVLTKLQLDPVTVPAMLLAVPDEPAVPSGRMQSAAADYIVHLKINDDECHLDVGAIAASQN
jgi:hypothetical protein